MFKLPEFIMSLLTPILIGLKVMQPTPIPTPTPNPELIQLKNELSELKKSIQEATKSAQPQPLVQQPVQQQTPVKSSKCPSEAAINEWKQKLLVAGAPEQQLNEFIAEGKRKCQAGLPFAESQPQVIIQQPSYNSYDSYDYQTQSKLDELERKQQEIERKMEDKESQETMNCIMNSGVYYSGTCHY